VRVSGFLVVQTVLVNVVYLLLFDVGEDFCYSRTCKLFLMMFIFRNFYRVLF